MLKKCNGILNILISLIIGVFMGYVIDVFWAYKTHPELYAVQSAPWYTGVFVYGIVMVILLSAAIMIKLIIWRKLNRQ